MADLAGHVVARGAPVHDGSGGAARGGMDRVHVDRPCGDAGVAVHGGPRPWRGELRGRGVSAGRDGGAMAAAGEGAATALRGETEHAEGTIGVDMTRRGRGAAHLRETGSAERSATAAAVRLTAAARVSAKRTRGGSGAKLGF